MNDVHACVFVNADDAGLSSCKSSDPLFLVCTFVTEHKFSLLDCVASQSNHRVQIITNNQTSQTELYIFDFIILLLNEAFW